MDENTKSTDNLITPDAEETNANDAEAVQAVDSNANDAEAVQAVDSNANNAVDSQSENHNDNTLDNARKKKDSGGVFAAILYLLGNFFLFNIVFILLLLPVVTIGPALTAYFDIVFTAKYDHKHRDYSVKMLLQRFREHLKLSISYFIGYLLVMGFFIALALVFSPIGPLPSKLLSVLFILLAGLLFAILIYTFPVLAINAVTSDYRASVYAIQDRDRREAKRLKDAEAKSGDSDPNTEASLPADETPSTPEHNTEVLTSYMKRFSKVTRTEIPSREIIRKADTSSSIKYFADDDKPDLASAGKDSADGTAKSADIETGERDTVRTGESVAAGTDTNKSSKTTTIAESTAPSGSTLIGSSYSELHYHEDRNSLSNVLLDSIYFAAKHFVGLMFTLCLYILPGLIIYIFYEDTVILVTGLVLIGARIIMGINARIYYGSFFEYDEFDDVDDDADEAAVSNDAHDVSDDEEAGIDNSEVVSSDDDVDDSYEIEMSIDDGPNMSATDDGPKASAADDDSNMSAADDNINDNVSISTEDITIDEASTNAADRIKSLMNTDPDDDSDIDIDIDIDADYDE